MAEYMPVSFSKLILFFFIPIFFFTAGIRCFLKYTQYRHVVAKLFISLFIILFCVYGINRSLQYSEKLWGQDATELVVLNAAVTFAEKGFTLNCGLPDYSLRHYKKDITDKGRLSRVAAAEAPPPKVYTHTPPGSSWLMGLFIKLCGTDTLSCPRILSAITACGALLFFAIMAYSAMGPLKSSVLIFFIAIIPLTRKMIWTFHYHNYAFSLFLVLTGYLLYFFRKKRRFGSSTAIILFVLAFAQGWFAYEYFALTLLSPVPFALIYSQSDSKETRKKALSAILILAAGFLSSAALHFMQNSFYFGSITGAFTDIYQRLETRSMSDKPLGWQMKVDRIWMSLWYFFVIPRKWNFFIINYPVFLGVCLILVWFKDISFTIRKPISVRFKWESSRRNYFAILSAFIASYLFIFMLFNSVANETPHMARILFFSYLICILTVLECIRSVVPKNQ